MTNTSHTFTPGPWINLGRVSSDDSRTLIGNKDKNISLVGCACSDEQEANARLIAAAPELLEALEVAQSIIERLTRSTSDYSRQQIAIRAAIAKAKGEV